MEKRFILFLCIAVSAVVANAFLMSFFQKPAPRQPLAGAVQQAGKEKLPDKEKAAGQPAEKAPEPAPADENARPAKPVKQPAKPVPKVPQQWFTLGSADPTSPYRMLVLVTNRGAAVEQVELNGGFNDLDPLNESGYLGPVAEADASGGLGAELRVVGQGTPAAKAGLKPLDVITAVGGKSVADAQQFRRELARIGQGGAVSFSVRRGTKQLQLSAVLGRRPIKVVSREKNRLGRLDQASMLLTLAQVGDEKLPDGKLELAGLNLLSGNWQVTRHDQDQAEFTWDLADRGLRIVKHYRVAQDAKDQQPKANLPGYHLDFTIEIRNTGDKPQNVAYQLDGPTGLPTEGWWYSNKISRDGLIFGSPVGVRDVALRFDDGAPQLIGCSKIADDDFDKTHRDHPLYYAGVDAQYFAAALLPRTEQPHTDQPNMQQQPGAAPWFENVQPIRVGPVPTDKARKKLTDTSVRLTSRPFVVRPGAGPLVHQYQIFVGPKKPEILTPYKLDALVYYGWFSPVSQFLLHVLHFFYAIVRNYGVAIIMLTVLVRSCMFPISRKQALGAVQKMQELQPELKKLSEKYKNNPEERTRATQELFKKHNYNPLAGCLPLFLQLPIFMGLYRALMIDVELRQAPLIPGLRWCSNLAAPDMVFHWEKLIPFAFLTGETGWLGPFFNLLPVITVGLFLWQQKMFMPPPADEQTAMQQKMMQYMMIFMAVMFFKVASGLCIYFIASSLWGIAERKLLPKMAKPAGGPASRLPVAVRDVAATGRDGNGAADRRKKQGKR